jgi:hypothetical protein
VAQARITLGEGAVEADLAAGGAEAATVLRSERCSRNSVNSTMRGSVLHHRMGWPSLNHGKMPWP